MLPLLLFAVAYFALLCSFSATVITKAACGLCPLDHSFIFLNLAQQCQHILSSRSSTLSQLRFCTNSLAAVKISVLEGTSLLARLRLGPAAVLTNLEFQTGWRWRCSTYCISWRLLGQATPSTRGFTRLTVTTSFSSSQVLWRRTCSLPTFSPFRRLRAAFMQQSCPAASLLAPGLAPPTLAGAGGAGTNGAASALLCQASS